MSTRLLLKRCFSAVVLALLSLTVYFQAWTAVRLVSDVLIERVLSLVRVSAPNVNDVVVPARERGLEPVVSEPSVLPLTVPAVAGLEPERAVPSALAWPVCDGVRVFIVTQSADPTWSAAALQVEGEARPRTLRAGARVRDQRVAFIGFNPKQQVPSVWLEGGHGACQVPLVRSPELAAASGGALSGASAPPVAPSDVADRIRKTNDAEFDVDASLVEQVIENPAQFLRVRVVPERLNGETLGLKLLGVRPNSVLALLGVRNGDRLESINGFPLGTPETALLAYARLRTASRLVVKLDRGGQPIELALTIR